jgi:hypothetical protein
MTMPDGSTKSFYNTPAGFPVFLDSGGTVSRLPTAIYKAVGSAFPTAQLDSSGFYIVSCADTALSGSVDFGFGTKIIRVLYKDFIWPVPSTTLCVVGILPEDSEFLSLSAPTFRTNL